MTFQPAHSHVAVRTSGRTHHEAFRRAMDALLLTCGLWNLNTTYRLWRVHFGLQQRQPIAAIRVGPVHKLLDLSGQSEEASYWYELDYAEQSAPFAPGSGWGKIDRCRHWAMRRLATLPYSSAMRALIVRYAEALSTPNPDEAFLQMWGLLEKMTCTVGGPYDETIRRAASVFKDGAVAKEVLSFLRCRRNRYVHAARSDNDGDQVSLMIKRFVDDHLLGLLRNDFKVRSLEEHAQCLSLSSPTERLNQDRKMIDSVVRFRGKRDAR